MSYRWSLTLTDSEATAEDLSAAGFDQTFISQELAESWLGENYLMLTDYGVSDVSLVHGEQVVYGPMSLEQID